MGTRDPNTHSEGTRDPGAAGMGTKDPSTAGRDLNTPMPWGQGLGTPAQAGMGLRTLMPWGQGPGTPIHAGRRPRTPFPWGQLIPSVPAPGTPQERLFGTQTHKHNHTSQRHYTTTSLSPSLSPAVPAKPHQERPKLGGGHDILLSQGPLSSSSEPPLPLITCDKGSRSVIRKTNLVTAN